MTSESLLPSALGVVVFLVPALALFFGGIPDRSAAVFLVLGLPAAFAIAFAEWLLLGSTLEVAVFQAALATASMSVVLSMAVPSGTRRALAVFGLSVLVVVVVPVGFALFDLSRGPIVTLLATLDFGGVATLALIPGCVGLALGIIGRTNAVLVSRRPAILYPIVAVAALVGFTCASLGAQLVFDDLSDSLVRNAVVAAIAGSVGWTVTQVINVHRATGAGAVAGVFAGSIVLLPASPWLNPVSVVVLGLIAGILGHISAVATRRTSAARWATVIGVCLVPGALGMIGSGIVANGAGLLFSGHIDLLQGQASGLLVVLLYATVVSLVLALIVDRTLRLTTPTGGPPSAGTQR